jgi:hypothetical protein
MDLASEQAVTDQLQIRERLEDTQGIVDLIRSSINAQALVIETTRRMTTRLCEMIGGEFRTSWRSLGEMVAKVLYASLFASRPVLLFNRHTVFLPKKHTPWYWRSGAL